MALAPDEELRQLLGESIPDDGSDLDTLFTNDEIQGFLDKTSTLDRAAYEGWRVKAARLSNLVDTTEGNAQRKFSQLFGQAQDMMKTYMRSSQGSTEGRTRVGRIKRPEVPW
jgi:hypothetical protein